MVVIGTGIRNKGWGGPFALLLIALVFSAITLGVFTSVSMALSPSVGSKAASNVDYSTAALNGTVNPNGLETKTYFEYGPSTSYGSKTAEVNVGSGGSALERAQAVSGLTPNTTYHYRVVATNADGTSTGGDRTFHVGWALQAVANSSTAGIFEDVSCSSASECTAVGHSGTQAIVQRWNGSEWKAQTVPKPEGATEAVLLGVSCPSSSACTAVGRYKNSAAKWVTLVQSWNGTEWKIQSSPSPGVTGSELNGVSCLSSSECTAVGYAWNSGPPVTRQTLVVRWNGSEWKTQTSANQGSSSVLASVSCASSTFCMATGQYEESAGKWAPLTERWNGTTWSLQTAVKPSGATMSWFHDVSCTSSTACTAVGDKEINATTHETQTMAQRWNGSSWSLQTTPNPEAVDRDLESVSCTATTACTATGFFIASSGGETPMALRWNGSTWTLQILPLPSGSSKARSRGVSCVAGRGCQGVGQFTNSSSVVVPLAEADWRKAGPSATTSAASSIGETAAMLNGTANPNGSETKTFFEYGKTTSYGSKTAEFNVGSGTSAVERSEPLSGLSPNTTYHYRLVANNENPSSGIGADATFTTVGPPGVITQGATPESSGESATLHGTVDPNGQSTTYQFEYGTSWGSYTHTVPIPAEVAGSGLNEKSVSYTISGLSPATTYYYRISATNASGKATGVQESFSTAGPPVAVTLWAPNVTGTKATLAGSVKSRSLMTKYQFEYGTSTSYGSKVSVPPKEVNSGQGAVLVEESLSGLQGNTVYHYRLVAENALGSSYGEDKTFTTGPSVTLYPEGSSTPLGVKAPLKVFSSGFYFVFSPFCEEAEFSGEVSENPGAMELVTTTAMQNSGGAGCLYETGMRANFTIPTKNITLEFGVNEAEEGVARLSKFILVNTIYSGTQKSGECEYEVEMSGTYGFSQPLGLALKGGQKLLKGSGLICSPTSMFGAFSVTSEGTPVEARLK